MTPPSTATRPLAESSDPLVSRETNVIRDLAPQLNRVVLVGQAPCRGGDPRLPLTGRAGEFLAKVMGVGIWSYLRWTVRVNVLDYYPGKSGKGDAFPVKEARRAAETLEPSLAGRRVLFVGKAVAGAFRCAQEYLGPWEVVARAGGSFSAATIPHPSRINRWWNAQGNREAAKRFLREAIFPPGRPS